MDNKLLFPPILSRVWHVGQWREIYSPMRSKITWKISWKVSTHLDKIWNIAFVEAVNAFLLKYDLTCMQSWIIRKNTPVGSLHLHSPTNHIDWICYCKRGKQRLSQYTNGYSAMLWKNARPLWCTIKSFGPCATKMREIKQKDAKMLRKGTCRSTFWGSGGARSGCQKSLDTSEKWDIITDKTIVERYKLYLRVCDTAPATEPQNNFQGTGSSLLGASPSSKSLFAYGRHHPSEIKSHQI